MRDLERPFETLLSGYGLIERPRVDDADRLYFSDARRGGVYRRDPAGAVETIVPKRRGVGGIAVHAGGGIVISGKNICHVRDGVSRMVFDIPDEPGFDDLITDAAGCLWVGTQRYNPFRDAMPVSGEAYRVTAERCGEMLYGDVGLTNGISLRCFLCSRMP